MKIGYARVSSNTQDLDLQIQELKKEVKMLKEKMDNNKID